MRKTTICGLWAGLFFCGVSHAVSQSRIGGVVTDQETTASVVGATLTLVGNDRSALTDSEGNFIFVEVETGAYLLTVEHIGYGVTVHSVTVPATGVLDVRIELAPRALATEPIVVTAVRDRTLERRGFYERRVWADKLGLGHFITRADIRQWPQTRLSHVAARVPMLEIERICPRDPQGSGPIVGYGGCVNLLRFRGSSPRYAYLGDGPVQVPCPADVWLDGIRMRLFSFGRNGQLIIRGGIDELGLPSELAGMEVYRGPAETPAEFSGVSDGCGAVILWTG